MDYKPTYNHLQCSVQRGTYSQLVEINTHKSIIILKVTDLYEVSGAVIESW